MAALLLHAATTPAQTLLPVDEAPRLSSPTSETDEEPVVEEPAKEPAPPETLATVEITPGFTAAFDFPETNAPPTATDDSGVLLSRPPDSAPPRPKPASARNNRPTEPTDSAPPSPESPEELPRQLERAAGEAKTPHALTRLIRRCESAPSDLSVAAKNRVASLNAWAHHARGRMRTAEARPEDALNDFRRAVRIDPTNTAARHDYAVSLAESGDLEQALGEFSRTVADAPHDTAARRNHAELLLRLGDPQRAAAECDTAIALLSQDRTGQAPNHLVQSNQAENLAGFYEVRGRSRHAAGRLREAAADFSESLRLKPGEARVLTHRGNVFAASRYYDQAIADYMAALAANPGSATAYRCLAWVLATCPEERLRDPKTAVEAAYRARLLSPTDSVLAFDASAAAHAASGDFAVAVRWQQRALMAAGESPPSGLMERLSLYQSGSAYQAPRLDTGRGAVRHAGHAAPLRQRQNR